MEEPSKSYRLQMISPRCTCAWSHQNETRIEATPHTAVLLQPSPAVLVWLVEVVFTAVDSRV